MVKWEYKTVINFTFSMDSLLKNYGDLGWELCAYDSEWHRAIFKRPIEEKK